MEDTTTARPATAQGSSTADLVKHLAEQVGCLLAAAIIGLAAAVAAWLAALIIGAGLLAAAGIAALAGRAELKKAKPPAPERALDSVRADVEEIKESAHR